MRIGVVVDSGCDLPKAFLDENRIVILPITVRTGGQSLVDNRDPGATLQFYKEQLGAKGQDAETAPLTVEEIRDLFLNKLVLDFDYVFCLTIAGSRSPIHDNAVKASVAILNGYKPIRQKAGITAPFQVRVMDTQNVFAGQGVTAVEAARMIKAGENVNKIRDRLDFIAKNTYMYGLPNDLFFLRARAQKKGDRSVGLLSAALGTALDIKPVIRCYQGDTGPVAKVRGFEPGAEKLFAFVTARVRAGLLTPTLIISYGGELDRLKALPGYAEMFNICRGNKIDVLVSHMSMTGAVNVGEGAVTVAFASEPHEIEV